MAGWLVLIITSLLLAFDVSHATVIRSCPGSPSSYFIADDSDPCVFYWCLSGQLISDTPMSCAPGTGVVPGYEGEDNPCTTHNSQCKLPIYPGWQHPDKPHHPTHYPHHPVPVPTPEPAAPGHHGYYAATAYLTQNAHIPGGMLQPHVHSLKYCWKSCVYSYNCKGFDYDPRFSTCWLHTDKTVCSPLEYKPYVNNFRLVFCPSTTMAPPTTVTTVTTTTPSPTAPPVVIQFSGSHLQGGTLLPGINTEAACFEACHADPGCQGLDFDSGSNSCWIHTSATECNALILKLTCTHYRFTLCEVPVVTPTAHAIGGTLINGISDPTSCFVRCVDPCVAVDFDSSTMTCWHHTSATCRNLEIKAQCVHLERPGKCP